MKENTPYTINKEEFKALKTQLHRIPETHAVDRGIAQFSIPKSRGIVRFIAVLSAAASITIAFLLWPSQTPDQDLYTEILFDDLYNLGYVEIRDFYSYIEPDSLGFIDINADSVALSNYNEYLNNYLNEI